MQRRRRWVIYVQATLFQRLYEARRGVRLFKVSPSVVRLLRTYAWRHRWSYALGFLCLGLTNWLTVEIPIQIGGAIDALGTDPTRHVIAIGSMGIGVIIVRTLSRVLVFNPGRDVEYALRRDLFAHLMRLQPEFYAMRRTGDIVSRAADDMTYARILIGFGLMQLVNVTLALSMTGWKMVGLSWQLTAAAVLPVVVGVGVARLAIRVVFELHRTAQRQLGRISELTLDSVQAITTIQGFGAADRLVARFERRNQDLFATRMRGAVLSSFAFPVLALAGNVSVFAVLFVGGPMAIDGSLSVGDVAAFVALLGILLPPLRSMGWMLSVLSRGQASVERIYELLDAPAPETVAADRPPERTRAGPAFRVERLTFAYPDAPEQPVLSDVSFSVESGEVVGVFGRTGSGKTTLLRLLSGLYSAPRGTVEVRDGARVVDLTSLSLPDWRRRLSVAPQRPFLFSDSIRDNVSLSESASDEAIDGAVSRAALDPDIAAFPDGLGTVVGERGIMLSGGQRQRVALARALFRTEAEVVLFDDVLSAVDHATEQAIVETLAKPAGDAFRPTTFIVSHRLSAIRDADKILVLENGRLIDQGTHAELISRAGPYQEAWDAQRSDGEGGE